MLVRLRPRRGNATEPLSRGNDDAPAPQQGSAGSSRRRLVRAADGSSDSDEEAQPQNAREEQPAAPAAPRVRVRRPQQPARQVVDHPAFITDDISKWPQLHSLGPIDQDGQHCIGCGAAHWFEA